MTNSEKLISAFSEQVFFKELVYSDLKFVPDGKTEVELADLLINLEDVVLAIQLKERNERDRTEDLRIEEKWLHDKRKKAKRQIAETIKSIRNKTICLKNLRGVEIAIHSDAEIVPLIVFDNPSIKHYKHLLSYQLTEEESVNCISFTDYKIMCKQLVSPVEIIEYIKWREHFYKNNGEVDYLLADTDDGIFISKPRNNETLITQYLYEKYGDAFNNDYKKYASLLNTYTYVLHEHTDYSSEDGASYAIVLFLAHLHLDEIKCFVERIQKSLNEAKNKNYSIVGSLRNTLRNYGIVFTATEQGGMIPTDILLDEVFKTQSVKKLLQVAMSWVNEEQYRIDFLYWLKND